MLDIELLTEERELLLSELTMEELELRLDFELLLITLEIELVDSELMLDDLLELDFGVLLDELIELLIIGAEELTILELELKEAAIDEELPRVVEELDDGISLGRWLLDTFARLLLETDLGLLDFGLSELLTDLTDDAISAEDD